MNAQPQPSPPVLEAPEQVEVAVTLRIATARDLVKNEAVWNGARYVFKNMPNVGQPYWVRSQYTNKMSNSHYIITEDTDKAELNAWHKQRMIYVPVSDLDLKDQKNV